MDTVAVVDDVSSGVEILVSVDDVVCGVQTSVTAGDALLCDAGEWSGAEWPRRR